MKRLFSLYINKVYTGSVFSFVLCLPLFLLTACGVHELPEDGGVDPTVVHTTIVLLPGADMTPLIFPNFHACSRRTYVRSALSGGSLCRRQVRPKFAIPPHAHLSRGLYGGSRFGMRPPCPQLSCGGMARLCTCRHFR